MTSPSSGRTTGAAAGNQPAGAPQPPHLRHSPHHFWIATNALAAQDDPARSCLVLRARPQPVVGRPPSSGRCGGDLRSQLPDYRISGERLIAV